MLRYYKRSQIHFVIFERLIKNPQQHLDDLCHFIGVDQYADYDLNPKNVGAYKEKMAPETHAWLKTVFQPYNERLYDFLGYEIDEWK